MRYPVIVKFIGLALLAGGCTVEVDDPVTVPDEPDAVVAPPDATPTAWPVEERAPQRNLPELTAEAKAIAGAADERAAALPSALLRPITQEPAACIKCLNLPSKPPPLPEPGDVR